MSPFDHNPYNLAKLANTSSGSNLLSQVRTQNATIAHNLRAQAGLCLRCYVSNPLQARSTAIELMAPVQLERGDSEAAATVLDEFQTTAFHGQPLQLEKVDDSPSEVAVSIPMPSSGSPSRKP